MRRMVPMRRSVKTSSRYSAAGSSFGSLPRFSSPVAMCVLCDGPNGASLLRTQLEPLDLPGRRLRQLVRELDPARVLVRRKLLLHVGLQLVLARPGAGLEHDVGLGLHQLLLVFFSDHGRL